MSATPPARQELRRDRRRSSVASNPWDCTAWSRPLPLPEVGAAELLWRLARLLYQWPDEIPPHLRSAEERRRRIVDVVAGYPELVGGGHPFDQPLHADSADALELALALDSWPPLAGGQSLRAEILWLDRIRRRNAGAGDHRLNAEDWLSLTLAWLLAGVATPGATEVNAALVLFDVLYDVQVREGGAKLAKRVAEGLVAAAECLAAGRPFPTGFAKLSTDGGDLGRIAEHLWWLRTGNPLEIGEREVLRQPAAKGERHAAEVRVHRTVHHPPAAIEEPTGVIEVRFHRIQSWLLGGTDVLAAAPNTMPLPGAIQRGASHLLEGILSAIRRALLDELGAGSLLVDGGGRLRFRCAADAAEHRRLDCLVCETIDGLFYPTGTLGRRFAGVLQALQAQGHLGAGGSERRLRQLAWAVIPPLSISFHGGGEDAGAAARRPRPVRRAWREPDFPEVSPAAGNPKAFLRAERQMSLPMRVRMEIGVLAPRERLLRVRFARGAGNGAGASLPRGDEPFEQLLFADLNRVGELFARCRDAGLPDREALARRSFRFTAHWLLAVTRTAVELDQPSMPEVLILGGDDLLIGTRVPTGELMPFATRLHERLGRLNAELPSCDGISLCAGLVRRAGSRRTGRDLLDAATRLEGIGKLRWKREVLSPSVPADTAGADSLVENRIGSGRRMSLILSWAASGELPEGTGHVGADAVVSRTRIALPPAADGFLLSSLASCDPPDGDTGPERVEVVVEEDTGSAFLVTLSQKLPVLDLPVRDAVPEPCCVAPLRQRRSAR
jgi:hypothetical protein